ncbi:GGDEF domain-containing protein [Lysobacter sp. SG-8]|uniref:diguanylate cyclase n=1 Tax=Marilutibacter penaei TaxID=2759900 RepID=A0A7W3U4W8_9GAMM|nr:GGDEF domain-containing protein [Lysobacter penaei]MBB1088989.1 GGDEF domain-containing protein [Lysobacter penaei]
MSDQNTDPTTLQPTQPSPGPRRGAPRSACVVVIHGEGLGKRADIDGTPLLIGRAQEADLCLPGKSVSRRHCEIRQSGEDYLLRDLGATNTTRLNEQPVDEAVLADGDHVTVGETILKFISDSSVEAHYHEEVYQLATHDALTELCNRRHFIELADKEIARAQRHARPLALCIVDVDLFKPVNDQYGHIAGDGVLRRIAMVMRELVRGEDLAARIGGEEFAVLLPEADLDAAAHFAERLRAAVAAEPFVLGGEARRLTVSIGIAGLSTAHGSRSRLMQAADAALYRAKESGRDRVCVQG